MSDNRQPITALVLAGTRGGQDPVAQRQGVTNKVLAKVGGEPMISRVLKTLEQARLVEKKIVCGPSLETVQSSFFLERLFEAGQIQWVEPQQGPSISVRYVLMTQKPAFPIFITTADHALLTPEMVDYFIREARQVQADVVVGLVPYAIVAASYPQSKRTVTRFSGESFCGCNMFLLMTQDAERLVEFWSHLERERKHPWRLIRVLGVSVLLRYVLGRLSLREALNRVGLRLDLCVKEIILPFPEAAIDVDSPEDLALAEKILHTRHTTQKHEEPNVPESSTKSRFILGGQ